MLSFTPVRNFRIKLLKNSHIIKIAIKTSYHHFTFLEVFFFFFARALAFGRSLGSVWPEVFSNLQEISQYSSWYQQCSCLDTINSTSDILIFKPPFQTSNDRTKRANYNCYLRHPHVPQFSFSNFHYDQSNFLKPNSLPIYWLYIILGCNRFPNFFSFFENRLMSSMYISANSLTLSMCVCV